MVTAGEYHKSRDQRWAKSANSRRFLVTDLVLGRLTGAHDLFLYLAEDRRANTEPSAVYSRLACREIRPSDISAVDFGPAMSEAPPRHRRAAGASIR